MMVLALLLAGCTATETQEGEQPELVGPVWVAAEIAGDATPVDSAVTLQLDEDARASGRGGCNQYGGPYTLAGNSLSFGALAATKMACEPVAAMAREQLYFNVLAKVTHYELRNSGELVLLTDDNMRIVLRRSDAMP
jgi:heat shock protein HslJ